MIDDSDEKMSVSSPFQTQALALGDRSSGNHRQKRGEPKSDKGLHCLSCVSGNVEVRMDRMQTQISLRIRYLSRIWFDVKTD